MRKFSKYLVFSTLSVLVLTVLNTSFHFPFPWWENESHRVEVSLLKSKFQHAIQEQNLAEAKLQYAALKKALPDRDPYLTDIANAYLADLYIAYAHQLAFNEKAAETLLAKAEALAPHHPGIQKAREDIAHVQQRLLTMDAKTSQIQETLVKAQDIIAQSVEEAQAIKQSLIQEQKTQVQEAQALAQLATDLEEPASLTVEDQLLAPEETPMNAEEIIAQVPMPPSLRDACSMAYYTREAALVSCMDKVDERRFGPALFVVGEAKHPVLAFSQRPITREDYNIFCATTHECYDDVDEIATLETQFKAAGVELDVRDVEQTVSDYNAYCQMTHSCQAIKRINEKSHELTKGQLQRYALWLSKTTGHRYRVTSNEDVTEIINYIDNCVKHNGCKPELLNQAKQALQYREKYLTRVTERADEKGAEG